MRWICTRMYTSVVCMILTHTAHLNILTETYKMRSSGFDDDRALLLSVGEVFRIFFLSHVTTAYCQCLLACSNFYYKWFKWGFFSFTCTCMLLTLSGLSAEMTRGIHFSLEVGRNGLSCRDIRSVLLHFFNPFLHEYSF